MIKKVILSIIALFVILFSLNIVYAVTGTVELTASSTSVKAGETFTVIFSAKCEDGINGIDTTYSYDQDKLELISGNVANNNWANLGVDNSITVISNTTSKVTSDDVYVLTFKVKDNIKNTTARISTSEIMVDSDLATDSKFTVGEKSVTVNIVSENTDTSNNNTNQGNSNVVEDNTTNKVNTNNTNNTTNPTNTKIENTNTSESKNVSSTDSTMKNSTDNTMSNSSLPNTGNTNMILIILIELFVLVAVILYFKMRILNKNTEK